MRLVCQPVLGLCMYGRSLELVARRMQPWFVYTCVLSQHPAHSLSSLLLFEPGIVPCLHCIPVLHGPILLVIQLCKYIPAAARQTPTYGVGALHHLLVKPVKGCLARALQVTEYGITTHSSLLAHQCV